MQTNKYLVSIIWLASGIHTLHALPTGMRYDAAFFCACVLPDIERNLSDGKRKKMLRGVYLHLDNAAVHKTKHPRQENARTKASRVVHLTYCPAVVQHGQVSFSLSVTRRVLLGRRLAQGTNMTVSGCHTKVGQQHQALKGDCDVMGCRTH
jgi:hypothetical protein